MAHHLDINNDSPEVQRQPQDLDKAPFPRLLAIKAQTIGGDLHKESNMDQQVVESKGEAHRHQPQERGMSMMPIKSYVS
jgi:hypothetical protein